MSCGCAHSVVLLTHSGVELTWDLMERFLRDRETLAAPRLNLPCLKGVQCNPGIS